MREHLFNKNIINNEARKRRFYLYVGTVNEIFYKNLNLK